MLINENVNEYESEFEIGYENVKEKKMQSQNK